MSCLWSIALFCMYIDRFVYTYLCACLRCNGENVVVLFQRWQITSFNMTSWKLAGIALDIWNISVLIRYHLLGSSDLSYSSQHLKKTWDNAGIIGVCVWFVNTKCLWHGSYLWICIMKTNWNFFKTTFMEIYILAYATSDGCVFISLYEFGNYGIYSNQNLLHQH